VYGNHRGSVALARTPRTNPPSDTALLVQIGVVSGGRFLVPRIDSAGYAGLQRIADGFSDTLVSLLTTERPTLESTYHASPYAREVSFDEYFMWWYHFYYSAVTDALIAEGIVRAPPLRTVMYAMTQPF
jgi:hypothetical protein